MHSREQDLCVCQLQGNQVLSEITLSYQLIDLSKEFIALIRDMIN